MAVIKSAIVELLEIACNQRGTQKNTTPVHVKYFLLSTQQTHKCDHTNRGNRDRQNFASTDNQSLRFQSINWSRRICIHLIVLFSNLCLLNFVWVTLVHVVAFTENFKIAQTRTASCTRSPRWNATCTFLRYYKFNCI